MPAPGEAMWLDADQDKVHAWLRAKHEVCPHCGTAESDWVEPHTGRLLDEPRWEATTFRCHGCAAVHQAGQEVPEKTAGVRVVLVPARHDDDSDVEG